MAATIGTVVNPDTAREPTFLTLRELAVLTVALAVVVGAALLLVLASSQVASALLGLS